MFRRTLARLNMWYDQVKEPKKFTIDVGVGFAPYLFLDLLAMVSGQIMFNILGILWVILIIALRVWWLHGNLKTHIDPR